MAAAVPSGGGGGRRAGLHVQALCGIWLWRQCLPSDVSTLMPLRMIRQAKPVILCVSVDQTFGDSRLWGLLCTVAGVSAEKGPYHPSLKMARLKGTCSLLLGRLFLFVYNFCFVILGHIQLIPVLSKDS